MLSLARLYKVDLSHTSVPHPTEFVLRFKPLTMKIIILAVVVAYVAACPQSSIDLACGLMRKAQAGVLHLATRHPSGVSDQAYAYNNIQDMCNGHEAHRSHYTCSECSSPGAPGGTVCLTHNLLAYLTALVAKGPVTVNELAGACHTCGSRHYNGQAVDLHNDGRSAEYLSTCTAMGGWGQNEGNHIHCQFYD